MILDVNVLLYAIDRSSSPHEACRTFLQDALNGSTRVGFPWATTIAFVRITTHPRILTAPLSISEAWAFVDEWMAASVAWVPQPTEAHGSLLRTLTEGLGGNLIPDAHLAALAIEYGVPVVSCDTDFARFTDATWVNPSR